MHDISFSLSGSNGLAIAQWSHRLYTLATPAKWTIVGDTGGIVQWSHHLYTLATPAKWMVAGDTDGIAHWSHHTVYTRGHETTRQDSVDFAENGERTS